MTRLTEPQRRALAGLTEEWREVPGRLSPAAYSLRLSRPDLVEKRWGRYGPKGGWQTHYRLTAAGMQAKLEQTKRERTKEAAG